MDFIQEKEKMQYEFLKKFPRRIKCRPICCHYTEQQSEVIMETVWIHKVR